MRKGYLNPMLLRSTDRGENWEDIPINSSVSGSPFSVVCDLLDPDLVYIGVKYLSSKMGTVYRSIDGGDIWTALNAAFSFNSNLSRPKIVVSSLKLSSQEMSTIYIYTLEGIFKSDDSGESWKEINSNVVRDLCITENGILFALHNNSVIRSLNDGEDWEIVFEYDQTDDMNIDQLYVDENNLKIYVAGTIGLFTINFDK